MMFGATDSWRCHLVAPPRFAPKFNDVVTEGTEYHLFYFSASSLYKTGRNLTAFPSFLISTTLIKIMTLIMWQGRYGYEAYQSHLTVCCRSYIFSPLQSMFISYFLYWPLSEFQPRLCVCEFYLSVCFATFVSEITHIMWKKTGLPHDCFKHIQNITPPPPLYPQ